MSLKGRSCWVVNIRMFRSEELSLEAIGRFVAASEEVRFEAEDRQQLYGWVEQVLIVQGYAQQGRQSRGLLRRYIAHGTFEQEREVLAIEALVRLGRGAEARARASAFTSAFPQSAHRRRIAVLLGGDD